MNWGGEGYPAYEVVGKYDKAKNVSLQQQQQGLAEQKQAFDQMLNLQQQIRNSFQQFLTPQGQGFDPATMSAMTSQFLNNNNTAFNNAGQMVRSALNARGGAGGALPVGGDFTRGIASLTGAKASSQSQGMLGLNIQNALQSLQNRFNAGSLISGQGNQLVGAQGNATSLANSGLNNFTQASLKPGFGMMFGQALGSGLGSGLAAGATGGLGSVFSTIGSGNFGW